MYAAERDGACVTLLSEYDLPTSVDLDMSLEQFPLDLSLSEIMCIPTSNTARLVAHMRYRLRTASHKIR